MRRLLVSSLLLLLASAAPALADSPVPFQGTWTGTTISAYFLPDGNVFVVAAGPGQASVVGKFVMTSPHISFVQTQTVQGTQVFVAANGDTVYATFTGALAGDPLGTLEGTLPATITGGTGRFAGASGTYNFHIIAKWNGGGYDSTATIDGTITLAH